MTILVALAMLYKLAMVVLLLPLLPLLLLLAPPLSPSSLDTLPSLWAPRTPWSRGRGGRRGGSRPPSPGPVQDTHILRITAPPSPSPANEPPALGPPLPVPRSSMVAIFHVLFPRTTNLRYVAMNATSNYSTQSVRKGKTKQAVNITLLTVTRPFTIPAVAFIGARVAREGGGGGARAIIHCDVSARACKRDVY